MATQTTRNYVNFDEFVEYQLEKARTSIRWTDLLTAGAGVASMVLAYLLVFTILDHWFVPGGFGVVTRALMLAILVLCAGGWVAWRIVVPYLRRVNRLYAARELERAEPGLRYSLLNLVDLQRSGRPVPDDILRALQKRAAVKLSTMNVEESVDRRWLMRASYLLLVLVVACCLYSVFSPKKISFLRPLSTAQAAVATQTTIVDVRPGSTDILAHSMLAVEVDLGGEVPESVLLRYTTADRKFVDETIELHPVDEGIMQFEGMLMGENGRGLLQDLSYRILAGDAMSDEFRVHVVQSPTAAIEHVRLEFPDYMELSARQQTFGDIDTWEGATVELKAVADQPVKSARILFFDDSNRDRHVNELRMDIAEERRLSARWTLEYAEGRYPSHYAIECRTARGETTRDPVLYSITVHPDQPPEVFLDPAGDLRIPVNGTVPLAFRAEDPDFKLRRVSLVGRVGERRVLEQRFFDALSDEWQPAFPLTRHDLNLSDLDVAAGDVLTVWVEARDNKPELGQIGRSHEVRIQLLREIDQQRADSLLEQQKQDQQERLDEVAPEDTDEAAPQPQQQSGGAGGEEAGQDGSTESQQGDPEGQGTTSGEEAAEGGDSPPSDSTAGGSRGEQESPDGSGQTPSPQEAGTEQQSDTPGQEPQGERGASGESGSGESTDDPDGGDADAERADHEEALRRLIEEQRQRDQSAQKETGTEQPEPEDAVPDDAVPDDSEQTPEQPEAGNAPPDQPDPTEAGDDSQAEQRQTDDPQPAGDEDDPQSDAGDDSTQQVPAEDSSGTPTADPTPASQAAESTSPESQPDAADPAEGAEADPTSPETASSDPSASRADEPQPGDASGQPEPSPQPAGESAEQQAADPSTTGDASSQDDPKAPVTQAENPDEISAPVDDSQRTTQPEQPPEPNGAEPQPRDGAPDPGSAAQPEANPQAEEGQNTQSTDPQRSQQQADPSQNPEAPDGERPEGPNEDLQGSGRPQGQSSEQPSGGEAGGSKQDDQGNSGSSETGPGETTDQPGANSKSDDPTGQPGTESGTAGESQSGSESAAQSGADSKGEPQDSPGSSGADSAATDSEGTDSEGRGAGAEQSPQDPSGKPSDSDDPSVAEQQPEQRDDAAAQESKSEPAATDGPAGSDTSEGSGAGKSPDGQPGGASTGTQPMPGGAAPGDRLAGDQQQRGGASAAGQDAASEPDAANLEYTKKAAELVLKRLEDQLDRGEVDDDLLKELGWNQQDLKRFTDRLRDQLYQEPGELTPESAARQRQFEETLRSFEIDAPGLQRADTYDRKESRGGAAVRRIPVPSQYRERYEAFTRSVSRQNTQK